MTTTAEAIKIMIAFLEGKKIEYRSKFLGTNRIWEDTTQPTWAWSNYEYRIAPIQPKPKTKLYAYLIEHENGTTSYLALFTDPFIKSPYHKRIPSEDKEIEL